nr:D-Ala-D-Ala carboxypeptidase family metallohydrolase [uncultured Draconibacterium sp.]
MEIRNLDIPLTRNFQQKEFFTNDPYFTDNYHEVDDRLVYALQWIRDFTNSPIRVTSSYRGEKYNAEEGGAPKSYHKKKTLSGKAKTEAIDWQFVKANVIRMKTFRKLYNDESTGLKAELYNRGIRGIIFYNTKIHMDTRTTEFIQDKTKTTSIFGLLLSLALIASRL